MRTNKVSSWQCAVGSVVLAVLAGCSSTRYVPTETVRDRWHTIHTADTMMIRDSVVIDRAGDTIRETRWRDRWRTHTVHDTIASCDTIREPYPVEVPAKLTTWQQLKLNLGGWAMLALGVSALFIVIRFKYKIPR